jgi:hypothetical protein
MFILPLIVSRVRIGFGTFGFNSIDRWLRGIISWRVDRGWVALVLTSPSQSYSKQQNNSTYNDPARFSGCSVS